MGIIVGMTSFTSLCINSKGEECRTLQSPKNMVNRGTRFLRKVSESEESQTMIAHINVASAKKYELNN